MITHLFLIVAGVLAYMSLWFAVSLLIKRNDVADVAWGLGFVLVIWIAFVLNPVFSLGRAILVLCITVWGLRLSFHIFFRKRKTLVCLIKIKFVFQRNGVNFGNFF